MDDGGDVIWKGRCGLAGEREGKHTREGG